MWGELELSPGWAAKSQVANMSDIVKRGIPSAIATFKVGSGLPVPGPARTSLALLGCWQ